MGSIFFILFFWQGRVVMVTDQTMVLVFHTRVEQMESVICSWVVVLGEGGGVVVFLYRRRSLPCVKS